MMQSSLSHAAFLSGPGRREDYFYALSAVLLLIVMFLGFQQFYLHGKAFPGRELAPPIRNLIILHGVSMTAWMILFMVQPFLIATGKPHVHRRLGLFGAGLAVVVVVFGYLLGVGAARVNPPELQLWGLAPKKFMAIPVSSVLLFGIFVLLGILNRRRPDVHRPMMLLSGLAAIPAAMDRVPAITRFYTDSPLGSIFGPWTGTLILAVALVLLKWALTRSWDRWFAVGCGVQILFAAMIMKLARTDAWDRIAAFLMG